VPPVAPDRTFGALRCGRTCWEFPENPTQERCMQSADGWLIADPEHYEEYELGSLKTGKEAEVFLVERVARDGRSCLLAHKRYRPREVSHKGELQDLGFQRAATFVNDRAYRQGRSTGSSRDRRAVARKSRHGKSVLRHDWPDTEFAMLGRLASAGVRVPYPVARTGDGVLMQYIGERWMAAPRLVHAGLDRATARIAAAQLVDNLRRMVIEGVVHADLSVYNLLWWEDVLWIIDLPQAVDIGTNEHALDFLHRDLVNVSAWFDSHGVAFDAERLFGELVAGAFGTGGHRAG
jgi:RIO kinase 1